MVGCPLLEGTQFRSAKHTLPEGVLFRPNLGYALKMEKTTGVPGWLNWSSTQIDIGLILAQVIISQFVNLSPASGSALTVWSLLGILFLPLSLPLSCSLSLSLSVSLSQNK